MKKTILSLCIFCLCSLYGTDMVTLTQSEKEYLANNGPITMCVDPDWEPFEIINKNGKHEGIASDLIQLIAGKIGVKIELIRTKDWDETLEFSKSKKCDILSFLNDTPKRREWLTFTNPIFKDPNVLIGRSDEAYIEDISQKHLSIALPRGTAIAERFANDFPNLTIIPTKSEAEAFTLVENRRADITLRSLIVTAYTIKKEGIFNLKIIGEPKGYENHLCIGVAKDKPILKDILNKAILQLTKEDVDKIVNNHVKIVIEKVTYLTIALWGFIALIFISFIILLWNYTLRKKVALEVENNLKQQKLLLEQKRKAEEAKLASMREMIGNIAHQWRQPLSVISTASTGVLLYKDMGTLTDEILETKMNQINNSAQFLSKTIDDFRDFVKDERILVKFDVADNITSFLNLVEGTIKSEHINIVKDIQENLMISGSPNELIQCYINLFDNSKDAFKDIDKDKFIFISATAQNNNIVIALKDNAGGIPKEVLPKIFEPYFTTKHQSQGTGLGLSMTYNFITQGMDGTIDAKNVTYEYKGKEYKGAEFVITLSNGSE